MKSHDIYINYLNGKKFIVNKSPLIHCIEKILLTHTNHARNNFLVYHVMDFGFRIILFLECVLCFVYFLMILKNFNFPIILNTNVEIMCVLFDLGCFFNCFFGSGAFICWTFAVTVCCSTYQRTFNCLNDLLTRFSSDCLNYSSSKVNFFNFKIFKEWWLMVS